MTIEQIIEKWALDAEEKGRVAAPDDAPGWLALAARIRGESSPQPASTANVPDEIARIQAIADEETERAQELEGQLEEEAARVKVLEEALAFIAETKATKDGDRPANTATAMWQRARDLVGPPSPPAEGEAQS